MEQLKAKLKKQGGFTMVELLIVVAIIAILVAVSIPMMNSALERSRHAVDQTNVRDAIALASVNYMTDPDNGVGTFYYHVDSDHQGYFNTTEEPKLKSACKCGATVEGLTITVTAPTGSGIDSRPTITTNWEFDGTTGATSEKTGS